MKNMALIQHHLLPEQSLLENSISSSRSLRLKFLLIPLGITVSLCGAICAGMGWYVWDSYKVFQKLQTQGLRMQYLSNQITYLDEVLTSSARLGATTGNPQWQERYLKFVPQLDAALAEAKNLLPSVFETGAISKTNEANTKLIQMEEKAFGLIQQKNLEAAKSILLSREYDRQKEIYSQGLEEATQALSNYVNVSIQKKSQQAFSTILVIGAAFIILLFAWIAVFRIIKQYLQTINEASIALSNTSTEIASTVEQQERTIGLQASSVNQTTTTMEELGASSRQSTEQAENSSYEANQALALAEDGTKSVQQTIEEITNLKKNVTAIAEQILHLSEQTGQISNISGLVANLANQTNMLALNASVEAARAGENGRGFSVVAGEIRKLADESKKYAEKINTLVTDIQASMNNTVIVTDRGTKSTDTTIKLAQATAKVFTGVTDAIDRIFLNTQAISLSAKQQAIAIQEVVAAMNSVNLGAKESSIGIAQIRVSTEQLNHAARKLKSTIEN